jgi:DNA-binding transcriptional ArsR family regulator
MLDGVIVDEFTCQEILQVVKEKPASVKAIAAAIEVSPPRVLRYLSALRKKGFVEVRGVEGTSPLYALREEGQA